MKGIPLALSITSLRRAVATPLQTVMTSFLFIIYPAVDLLHARYS